MRKLSVLVFAIVAMLAAGNIAATGAKNKQKVKSQVSLQFDEGTDGYPYYEEAAFKGKVGTKGKASKKARKACKRGRTVIVTQIGAGKFGQAKTNKKGRYTLSGSDAYNAPGRYKATVKKKKKGKIVCKKTTSEPVKVF